MTATLRLWEIGDELDAIREQLYESEGALTPELEQQLNDVTLGFEEKAERVALYVRELQANAKAVKEEAARLAQRSLCYEKTADSLKHYLQAQMERAEIPKVEGKLISVRLQKSPPSVISTLSEDELKQIPAAFVTYAPESYRLNAKAVIDAWKARPEFLLSVPGVSVVQTTHVRIA